MRLMPRRWSAWPILAVLLMARPAGAAFVAISPEGPAGPGGSITFSQIGPFDTSSANVNTDFSSTGPISITFSASDRSPVSIYGDNVNDTGTTWVGFSAMVVAGLATFQAPNDPFDPQGTYTNTRGFSVSLADGGRTALFQGGTIAPGDSLDTFLGLSVTDPSRAVTVTLTPIVRSAAVPEPTSLALSAIAATLALVRLGLRGRKAALALAASCSIAALTPGVARAQSPRIAPAYEARLAIAPAGTVGGGPTQMTFGPGGRLYMMTTDAGVISYAYDRATGALSAPINAAPGVRGIGIGFRDSTMYTSGFDGSIHKLTDDNANGVWGEAGELDVAIVTGIPQGDHNMDQIQIVGKTLYVGIGTRTINGQLGAYTSGSTDDLGGTGFFGGGTGRTYGDSAYNGTIAWIRDLDAVVDQPGSANAFATRPPTLSRALIQEDAGPFSGGGPGSLVVHSAGTRNPFGLCLDRDGNLWFTNNFHRVATLGNGKAGFGLRGDLNTSDLGREVQDQLFRAAPGADYGYSNANWRGVNPMLTPSAPGYNRVTSTTFDNLFNNGPYAIHDPANPDGLGPSASADGCAFFDSDLLPAELRGNVFIARYSGTITEAAGGLRRSIAYGDLVAVDVASGKVRRVASGFEGPLAVLADDASGRLLIATLGDRTVYAVQAIRP